MKENIDTKNKEVCNHLFSMTLCDDLRSFGLPCDLQRAIGSLLLSQRVVGDWPGMGWMGIGLTIVGLTLMGDTLFTEGFSTLTSGRLGIGVRANTTRYKRIDHQENLQRKLFYLCTRWAWDGVTCVIGKIIFGFLIIRKGNVLNYLQWVWILEKTLQNNSKLINERIGYSLNKFIKNMVTRLRVGFGKYAVCLSLDEPSFRAPLCYTDWI